MTHRNKIAKILSTVPPTKHNILFPQMVWYVCMWVISFWSYTLALSISVEYMDFVLFQLWDSVSFVLLCIAQIVQTVAS